ncbi:MAG: autotransporter-associated beta strand repeat-containing protein [Terrimicrobiaceae bacterium]
MKSKSLLNKIDTILAAGLLTASIIVAPSAQAANWNGTTGNWSSDGATGWNGTGVPNAVGAVANHAVASNSNTTQDVALGVTVGTISLTNNSNNQWTHTLTNGITLNQDNAGSGSATISNTNTFAGISNFLQFQSGNLTLADNLLISNTGASTRTMTNGGAINFTSTSVIAGSGNLTIDNVLNDLAGVGCIRFSGGTNTFTGNVNVRSGGTTFSVSSSFGGVATNVITLGASGSGSASLLASAGVTVVNDWVAAAGSGGTLTLGSIGTAGLSYNGTGTLNGDLTLLTGSSAANRMKMNGVISGTGNITMSGTGVADMTNANTYSGSTTVSSGILRLNNALALQNSALNTTASVTGDATSGLQNTALTTLTLGGLTGNKNLADVFTTLTATGGYSGVTALTLNPGTGVTHTYSAAIANGAANMTLTKTGNGTQILDGTNTYTGSTTVSAGTLLINGSTASGSAVSVMGGSAASAVLGGTGTIGGSISFTTATGGILAVGGAGAVGTLTTGAVSATLASNISMELNAAGTSSDLLKSSGLTATNFTLNLTNLGGTFSNGQSFQLFQNQAGGAPVFSGTTFAVIVKPTLTGGLTWDESSLYTSGTLSVVPEPSTWALLAFSLTTVMVLRRRRRS